MSGARHRRRFLFLLAAPACIAAVAGSPAGRQPLRFAIVGDRTGGAQPGVYEAVWRELAARSPDFVVTTGDAIQGLNDATAAREWEEFERILRPYRGIPLYPVAGNHDVWSAASERLFERHAGKSLHYSFDRGGAHFTILDTSRSDALPEEELSFLEQDLKTHAAQPVKFVISHRPAWIMNVAFRNPDVPLHRLARRYGVQYVIAGHVHQLLHFELDGVTYISMPSSGAHLRASGKYEDGWLYGYAMVEVEGAGVRFHIQELKPPHGRGRTTRLADWGMLGLMERAETARR